MEKNVLFIDFILSIIAVNFCLDNVKLIFVKEVIHLGAETGLPSVLINMDNTVTTPQDKDVMVYLFVVFVDFKLHPNQISKYFKEPSELVANNFLFAESVDCMQKEKIKKRKQ